MKKQTFRESLKSFFARFKKKEEIKTELADVVRYPVGPPSPSSTLMYHKRRAEVRKIAKRAKIG